jgi:hypothetical protein
MSKISEAIKTLHGPEALIPECTRFDLPDFFVDMGYKVGAEIGVEMGRYTKYLCVKPLQIYAIDPWLEYEDFSSPHMLKQKRINKTYEYAKQNLSRFPNCTIIRKTSMEAAKDFKDGSLDFVFIDGHHGFKYVAEDLWEWSKKVRSGGTIAGHDYVFLDNALKDPFAIHVGYVVKAFTECFKIKDWYRLSHIRNNKRDRYESYFWINP